VIELEGVTKAYGPVQALAGVGFRVEPGEVFGLLGHNGAGKSTLAKVLCGLVRPDAGAAKICGIDIARDPLAARAKFGYLPEETLLYDELTGREHVELFAALRGLAPDVARPRAARLLEFLDLAHAADRLASTYSRGMRRKTAIAMTVVGDPEALLFDEPTDGLDPDGALRFAELLAELARRGRTVIVNTHILGLVEKRARRIGVLDKGRLLACGTLDDLRAQAKTPGADLEDVFLALTGRAAKGAEGLLD
jgi:ABC-2 type transport system ATP-binding protein